MKTIIIYIKENKKRDRTAAVCHHPKKVFAIITRMARVCACVRVTYLRTSLGQHRPFPSPHVSHSRTYQYILSR